MTLRNEMRGVLDAEKLRLLPSAFDILGNKQKAVAIIEVPQALSEKKREIAEAMMRKHKNVKSVLNKLSARKGIFRTREYEVIGGDRDTEVMHVESGCRFILDVQTCYFSQRESTERMRLASEVRKGETVMIFFSGVGPFPVIISRKSKADKIIGIEINDKAVFYAKQNAALNKTENVECVFGDVHNEAQRFYGKCDRVVMPLPEKSAEFLGDAAKCLKSKGTVHLYCFATEKDVKDKEDELVRAIKNMGFHASVAHSRKVLPYGPRIWKMRFDILIKKR